MKNPDNYNIEIFRLRDNKSKATLIKHQDYIKTIRYFINDKNENVYPISGNEDKKVIVWDITNNYNIKCNIDTKYRDTIFSCLFLFPNNLNDNYIITSISSNLGNNEKSATKIFLLKDENNIPIKYFDNPSNESIYYLLSW